MVPLNSAVQCWQPTKPDTGPLSSLAGLEVTKKFVDGGGFQVATVSNLNRCYFELSFDNNRLLCLK